MDIRTFFRTIPSTLNWLTLASCAVLLLKIFLFNRMPELIPGFMQLGAVFEGVLGSILASYVFYLIVVHFKEQRDQVAIYPYVMKWSERVIGDCRSQVAELSKAAGCPVEYDSLTSEVIEQVFKKIDPKSDAPLIFAQGNHANWLQYFEHHMGRSRGNISKVMAQLIFLEGPLVAHLLRIDDCHHFTATEFLRHHQIRNQDLSVFAGAFYDYYLACKQLDLYLKNMFNG